MFNKILITSLLLVLSFEAFSSVQSGKVIELQSRIDGVQWVVLEGQRAAKPDCAKYQPYFMIKNPESAIGKNQFAMLLAAYSAGHSVVIEGAGECTVWGDGEDIKTVGLGN